MRILLFVFYIYVGFVSQAQARILGVDFSSSRSLLDMDVRQTRYFGETQNAKQGANYSELRGDLVLTTKTSGFEYKINPMARGLAESSDEFYFGIPEAYVEPRKLSPWFHLTVGRQRREWSRLDEAYDLGVWQPQLRWDYLEPVQQGLTGIFIDVDLSRELRLVFFTSPVHLPDQGPNFKLKNGQFESSNRWFVQPRGQVRLFSGTNFANDAPLFFELERPAEEEIIAHSSYGLGIQYDSMKQLWSRLHYAYKPRNQIHIGLECANCADISNPTTVEITARVHAKVVKHHVLTWETGLRGQDDEGWLSITGDVPEKSGYPSEYEEAPLKSMLIMGAGYDHRIGASVLGVPTRLTTSYMRKIEQERKNDDGGLTADDVQSSLDRYGLQEVASIGGVALLRQVTRRRLELETKYHYAIPEKGGWLSSRFNWMEGPVSWFAGLDILGSESALDSGNAGLFTRYRSNDRVFAGMSYVF